MNQCDGCRSGIPVVNDIHWTGNIWNSMACQKDRYSDDEDHDELYGRDDYKDYPPEGSGQSDEYFRERD